MKIFEKTCGFANSLIETAYRDALMGNDMAVTNAEISKQVKEAVDGLYKDDTCAANREADRLLKKVRAKVLALTRHQPI